MLGLALFFRLLGSTRGATNGAISYSVRGWQTDDGLPQNSVFAIAQTTDGYLWVGTREGLARFDGLRFMVADDKAAPHLRHGWITALCAARDGSLWIACDGAGITRLKDGRFTNFTEAEGLPSNQTRCLLEDSGGALWIGSEAGLARLKDGKFMNFTEKNGLGDNSVRALCQDHEGRMRVATKRGLSSLDSAFQISTANFGLGTIANALKSVCEDRQGGIWVAANDGLTHATGDKKAFYSINNGLPDRVTTSVYEDRQGQIWVGTYGGLARVVGGTVLFEPNSEVALGGWIYTLFEDREENLWVGARDGLYRLTRARFTAYTTKQGLTCNNVMSVREGRDGTICIGTWGGGLNLLRGDKVTAYGTTNGLAHDSVLSVLEAHDGSLWVGMDFDGGLNHLKEDRQNDFPRMNGLTNAAIRVIHEDRVGTLWIGTSRGLKVLKKGKLASYTTSNGLAGNTVMAICDDGEGSLWVGTDGGISRWNDGKFASLTTRDGLANNGVNALYLDNDRALWIGTRGGLNRFKDGKFTTYTAKQGLFSDEIYEIIEDDFGYFWMSCRNGIFRVNKKSLDDFDHGIVSLITSTAFGKADGLVSVQCNGVAKPAGWKGRDGRLWFPTIRGVVAVDSRLKTNDKPPLVAIEEIIADKKVVETQGSVIASGMRTLTIPPGRGELEIHYTALSFQAPEKNRFKYIMEKMDPEWVDPGPRRVAYYNNITPGNYRFRVIASNNDGVWNETGAVLALVFQPHYWQTWWFKLAIAAAVGGLLTFLYRSRVRRLRDLERLRIQIAADLHDDVGARLTKVAMVTEFLDHQTPGTDRSKTHIQNLSRTTREVIQAMDEIVWTINPKNDTLDNLANYIFQYAQEYFQNTSVRCRLDLPAGLPDYPISTEERHNLFMAVKEALNNVLKHAGATEVRIGLSVVNAKLAINIADNGSGFLTDQKRASGDGLENMKQRLERIGGRLTLESQPGEGTRIRMEAEGK
jgi:ligand-binding sensor domain-containing protein/two-component sensor histidine kinase